MQNILGNEIKPLKFQKKIIKKVSNKDAIVVMPTNSGKTIIAYAWSDITSADYRKIIFTAPIKALSVERYQELKRQGLDVGLVTGDVVTSTHNDILCMTQEIYNNHFFNRRATVIIDEFHYIFRNKDRARCYIDSIKQSNPQSKLLLMSATIDKPCELSKWLSNLSNRKFVVAESNQRLVELKYDTHGIDAKNVKNAIVFCFGLHEIRRVIDYIINYRTPISDNTLKEISDLAYQYRIQWMNEWNYGISRYHGKLLPKEKMFIEYWYRRGVFDTIVGTDALALGVNLPAKYAILAQTHQIDSKLISASLFKQLTGRAGRYGCYEQGIGTFLKNSPCSNEININDDFKNLVNRKLEKTQILVEPDYKALLNNRYIEEEIDNIIQNTYNHKLKDNDINDLYYEISSNMIKLSSKPVETFSSKNERIIYFDIISKYYLQEWDIDTNVYYAQLATYHIVSNGIIDTSVFLKILEIANDIPGVELYKLLLIRKWLNAILDDKKYLVKNYNCLIDRINNLDHTVLNPEIRLD